MISSIIREDIEKGIIPEFKEDLKILEGETILITGGNGLIASYLVDTIAIFNSSLQKPCKIVVINRNPMSEKSRLSHLMNDKNVNFISQDVGKPFEVPKGVSYIIHAASRANPKAFLEDPMDTLDANVNGLRTLLDYAKENPVKQFIFFSSGENYGNPLKEFIPTPETYTGNVDPIDPRACYIESKRFCETLSMVFFRKYNVPVKLARILLSYGPGIRFDGKVVSDFFMAALKDKKISIKDKGDAKRSFCYVADTIRAVLYIMFKGKPGEAYNIADDTNNVTIKELAELIASLCNNKTIVETNENAPVKEICGVNNRLLDISKLKALGFSPKTNLREGLYRLNKHYEEERLI